MLAVDVEALPLALREEVLQHWQALLDSAGAEVVERLQRDHVGLFAELPRVWACSRFLAETCCRHSKLFVELLQGGELLQQREPDFYARVLGEQLAEVDDAAALMNCLRRFRRREMMRILWRDLARRSELRTTTAELSSLADACLDLALDWHHQALARRFGRPLGEISGAEQRLVVLGMGKLGASELNLSSDIDLLFAFAEAGETDGKKSLSNQEFFTRLAQALIRSIDAPTAEGFVFRVDMRLRPYGDSGALVLSFGAMEEYYQDQGRDWERYAMIKARVCAGDLAEGRKLIEMLRPFTYRKYLDFSAIDALRNMKAMINREVRRRGKGQDIKLGAGGIREVEFIVQSFQLIRGGRLTELQQAGLFATLEALVAVQLLPLEAAQELREAYIFLRNTEHALQAWADQQTQRLPEDETACLRLAFAMGYPSWQDFSAALQEHRDTVRGHFAAVISGDGEDETAADLDGAVWGPLWTAEINDEAALQQLAAAGFEQAEESLNLLLALRDSRKAQAMQPIGRERLASFMPRFLAAQCRTGRPSLSLARSLPLVEAVMRRSAYLVLLEENPPALEQLLRLCSSSPMIARQLTQHPALLDELLDSRHLYTLPDRNRLRDELRQQMLRIDPDNLEEQMEGLRYFRHAQTLRAGACELSGVLPLMQVSDYLTFLAEAILEYVLPVSRRQLVARHGVPRHSDGSSTEEEFLVVAYGKMGGIELSYGSDLDLVFLHDAESGQYTDGERCLDAVQFFTRLSQRVIHVLGTTTREGKLYEVDVRLRPSGESGLLVASMASFRNYQLEQAWTWEHQALVRARALTGSTQLARQFDAIRREVLCLPRDPAGLAEEVVTMRVRMREHLLPGGSQYADQFHLKHSPGGIVDIEFMVQYAVLAWSSEYPALAVFTDNIRILEALRDTGLFSDGQAALLTDAYKAYRSAQHRLALEQEADWVPESEFQLLSEAVQAQWREMFAGTGAAATAEPEQEP